MRFTLVRQTNLTQKGRQENRIYFCTHVKHIYIHTYLKLYMYICYTDKYVYSLYERSFFDVQHWHWGPRQKICIITYTICVYHTAMPIISAHEDQHHICQHIYTYIYIWSTWPKAHSKNQTQINCNWTQINCALRIQYPRSLMRDEVLILIELCWQVCGA